VIAGAKVLANGTFAAQQGFVGSSQLGPGEYDLLLASPPASLTDAVAVATILDPSPGGEVTVNFGVPNHVFVHTSNSAGVSADHLFMIVVYDVT